MPAVPLSPQAVTTQNVFRLCQNCPWRRTTGLTLLRSSFLLVSAYFSCSKTLFEIRKDKMHPNNMTIDMTNPYLMVKIGIQLCSCIIFWPNRRVEIPPVNPSWLFQVKRNQGASNFCKPAVFERFCHLDCSPNPSPKIFDFWLRMKRTM